jgi:hypothetical protein
MLCYTAVAQAQGVFYVDRPDLACYDRKGTLTVSKAGQGGERPEPVWLEPLPTGWKAADFTVIIEGGKCIRRPVARNLDREDAMLQFDARNARKAAREVAKAKSTKELQDLVTLQGADETVVTPDVKVLEPRVPREVRRDKRSVADKLSPELQDKLDQLFQPEAEAKP